MNSGGCNSGDALTDKAKASNEYERVCVCVCCVDSATLAD